MSVLSRAYFHDEIAAFAYVEGIIWAQGVICPHCGVVGSFYNLAKTRVGLKKCKDCKKQFTVRIGTIFEDSHLPMHKWLQAIHLMCSSKKGISAHQLHRVLECQYKTAWHLAHRIREAMRSGDLAPFGGSGGGGIVEVDETFIGRDPKRKLGVGYEHKQKVLALVDRDTKRVRSMVVEKLTIKDVTPILQENIAKEAHVMTDQAGMYYYLKDHFRAHDTVNHAKDEYSRQENGLTISTNTIEGYFSIFKRGMKGVYQHCSKKHLHRYLAEFDFRYNYRVANGCNDAQRATEALLGVVGKRLTYRRIGV